MRGETGGDQYAGNVLAADETFKQQHNEGVTQQSPTRVCSSHYQTEIN